MDSSLTIQNLFEFYVKNSTASNRYGLLEDPWIFTRSLIAIRIKIGIFEIGNAWLDNDIFFGENAINATPRKFG